VRGLLLQELGRPKSRGWERPDVQDSALITVRNQPIEVLVQDKTIPGRTSSTRQWVGRRRTRSPNLPNSERIRDDTTALPHIEARGHPDTRRP
jgi:hypothetical protein